MTDILIDQNIVVIRFVSDAKYESSGFKLTYQIEFEKPVDCEWGDFFPVTQCTKQCNGTQFIIRGIKQNARFGGKTCSGQFYDLAAPCNQDSCCKYQVL